MQKTGKIQEYVDECKARRKKLLDEVSKMQYTNPAYWQEKFENLARENIIIDTLEWVLEENQ